MSIDPDDFIASSDALVARADDFMTRIRNKCLTHPDDDDVPVIHTRAEPVPGTGPAGSLAAVTPLSPASPSPVAHDPGNDSHALQQMLQAQLAQALPGLIAQALPAALETVLETAIAACMEPLRQSLSQSLTAAMTPALQQHLQQQLQPGLQRLIGQALADRPAPPV